MIGLLSFIAFIIFLNTFGRLFKVEVYLQDIFDDIKQNPTNWVAILNNYGDRFDGIKNIKTGVDISGYDDSNSFMMWIATVILQMKLTINGIDMPLRCGSKNKLFKVVNNWKKNVPALHLLGDISLIKIEDKPKNIIERLS